MIVAVKTWLSQHANWLLILDNADDLALLPEFLPSSALRASPAHDARPGPGWAGRSHRTRDAGFGQRSAAAPAARRSARPGCFATRAGPADWQTAVQLALELGCLPLALDQAGAYLEETRCGLSQYLELSRSHRADLLRHRGGLALDHPDPVATTWSLSFALIEQRSALAADLLRLCAVLHPDSIPEALFLQAAVHLGPILAAIQADPLAFNQALAVIGNYSLMRRNAREQTLSIHRLVQAVLAEAITKPERELWTERAIAALNALFPEVRDQGWGHWEQCGRLLPHVLTVAANTPSQTHSLELAAVLTRAANYLCQRAQYEQAEPLYQRALSICEQRLGRDHPQVAFPLCGPLSQTLFLQAGDGRKMYLFGARR